MTKAGSRLELYVKSSDNEIIGKQSRRPLLRGKMELMSCDASH